MRQNFADGQEIIHQDLNKIPSKVERLMFDKILYELIGRNQQGFFQDSFKVSRVSNTEVSVKSGLGFQFVVTDASEPNMKPVIIETNSSQIIPTANPTNDRYDIIVVKAELVDGATESRKFKDAFTNDITTQSTVVEKVWVGSFQIITGVPDAAPTVPAIPAGYIKLADILVEAANGIVAESNISDQRILLPLAGSVGLTGSTEYDAIIGDSSLLGISHETLKAALDDPTILSGAKILVTRNETIGSATIPEVIKDNIEIVFKPNVTFTKGDATKGLILNANGTKLTGARFSEFVTGGDIAIEIVGGKIYNIITENRFLNCDSEITGLTGKNIANNNIVE